MPLTKLAHGNYSGYFQALKEALLPYRGNDEHLQLICNIHRSVKQTKEHLLMNEIQLPTKENSEKGIITLFNKLH